MNNKNNANVNEVKEIDGYIKRQRVLNVISNLQEEYENSRKEEEDYFEKIPYTMILKALARLENWINKTTPENVKLAQCGEWRVTTKPGDFICSICGRHGTPHEVINYNFCPNCGADMRGKKVQNDE